MPYTHKALRRASLAVLPFLAVAAAAPIVRDAGATFTNPLLDHGPDPWVVRDGGWYYFLSSTGTDLTIFRTRDITDLRHAEKTTVWVPPKTGPYSKNIWAPELHKLDGKWYLYFAADDGRNENHRMYVLENASGNPLAGRWTFKGKVADATDRWAIDGTVFENDGPGGDGHRYMLWSGWEGAVNGQQNIYIARLRNPWTIEGPRVLLSRPQYGWETIGTIESKRILVNEGPEILKRGNRLFLTYSASGCWTDAYKLGLIEAVAGTDLMKAGNWRKHREPVLRSDPASKAFGVGHNGFFKSPDGREDWIIYHANPAKGQGCGDKRSPRMQRIAWGADGQPHFGRPVPLGAPRTRPGGSHQ